MARVLILYAHPGQRHSLSNRHLAKTAGAVPGVSFVDLYAQYPRFKIDIDAEQKRLLAHDVIIMQFPIFWYSTPSLLKEWQDLVLEYGFAYGPEGKELAGKKLLLAVTSGGTQEAYSSEGYHNHSLRTLLTPLEQTAHLCGMTYLPPLVLFSAHSARKDGRGVAHADTYAEILEALRDDQLDLDALSKNDLFPVNDFAQLRQKGE